MPIFIKLVVWIDDVVNSKTQQLLFLARKPWAIMKTFGSAFAKPL